MTKETFINYFLIFYLCEKLSVSTSEPRTHVSPSWKVDKQKWSPILKVATRLHQWSRSRKTVKPSSVCPLVVSQSRIQLRPSIQQNALSDASSLKSKTRSRMFHLKSQKVQTEEPWLSGMGNQSDQKRFLQKFSKNSNMMRRNTSDKKLLRLLSPCLPTSTIQSVKPLSMPEKSLVSM